MSNQFYTTKTMKSGEKSQKKSEKLPKRGFSRTIPTVKFQTCQIRKWCEKKIARWYMTRHNGYPFFITMDAPMPKGAVRCCDLCMLELIKSEAAEELD